MAPLVEAPEPHLLSDGDIARLAPGEPTLSVVLRLIAAEYSRRLVLLRAILAWARRVPGADSSQYRPETAWDLMAAAEAADPAAARAVLMDPHVGLWAANALRDWDHPAAGAPGWTRWLQLNAVAASAAIRCGVDFSIDVPVIQGQVVLPDLGCASVPGAPDHGTATVSCRAGRVRIEAGPVVVDLPADASRDADRWRGLRRVVVSSGDRTLSVTLNDLDPHRLAKTMDPPARLSDDAFEDWRRLLTDAWLILVADHPEAADVLAAGLRSIIPLPRAERFRPRSGSGGDAFGCAVLSLPDDAVQLAVTLVHEFRHSTLSAVLHLTDLYDPAAEGLFYAPWRDDPRPLGGLFQGVFAFCGIRDFWERRRRVDTGEALRLAEFEYALSRRQAKIALDILRANPNLTPIGRRIVDRLADGADRAATEELTGPEHEAGDVAALDHQGAWNAHHAVPDASVVSVLCAARAAGAPRPAGVTSVPVQIVADPGAAWLDSTAVLQRWRIADPAGFAQMCSDDRPGDRVLGATVADLAHVAGDADAAAKLYHDEAVGRPDRPSAWGRLQRCRVGGAPSPAPAELLRAVHTQLVAQEQDPGSPWELVEWWSATPDEVAAVH